MCKINQRMVNHELRIKKTGGCFAYAGLLDNSLFVILDSRLMAKIA